MTTPMNPSIGVKVRFPFSSTSNVPWSGSSNVV